MQANCTARNAPILTYESILMSMSCHRLYENESTFGLEYNLDWSCFDLSKCNSNSNFSSISVFCKSANFNSNLICYSCVSSNFNSNLISKSKKNFICPSLPATAEIEKWLRIRVHFFTKFWISVGMKNADICWSQLRHCGSMAISGGLATRDERTLKFFSPSIILIRRNWAQSSDNPQFFLNSWVWYSPEPPVQNHVLCFCLMRQKHC